MINRRMILLSAAAAMSCVKAEEPYVPLTPPKLEPAPLLERSNDQRPRTRDRTIEFNGRRLYRG